MKETRLDELRDVRFIVKMLVKNDTKILSRGFDIGKGIDVMTDLHREVISFTCFVFFNNLSFTRIEMVEIQIHPLINGTN